MCRYDRTGDHTSRVKMTQDIVKAINDGLYYYEEDLWEPSEDEEWVSSQLTINKNKNNKESHFTIRSRRTMR